MRQIKNILYALLIISLGVSDTLASNPPPGVRQSGAVTTGHCTQWLGNNTIQDAGSACGSGGAISLSTNSNGIVLTPNPITGTGTIDDTTITTAQTGTTYSINATDMDKIVALTNASAMTVTLAVVGSTGFETGKGFIIINKPTFATPVTGVLTLNVTTSKINGKSSLSLAQGQWAWITAGTSDYTAVIGGTGYTAGNVSCVPIAITLASGHAAADATTSCYFTVALSHLATTTIDNPTNAVDGMVVTYELTQDASGSNAVAWDTAFNGCASGIPSPSTGANKVDMYGWRYSARLSKWLALNGTGLGC